jgi:5-dehydro-2-deoxygluconokinase
LHEIARRALWVGRAVQRRASLALEAPCDVSLALRLTEWPTGITAICRCEVYAEYAGPGLREGQERGLQQIAAVCRAQARELLLEIVTGRPDAGDADTVARTLARIYALDVRPDWWLLEAQPDIPSFEACTREISANDPHCRGILLGLATAAEATAALPVAAAIPRVRGFVAGGSIFGGIAAAWLAGQLSDEAALAQVAERFAALADAWSAARDPRHDQPRRSAD